MASRSRMLDEALSIGRRELTCLVEGDVFGAEKFAHDRERILDEALEGLSGGSLRQLSDKLREMRSLHEEITGRARELRASLKQDLTSMKRQNKRISGYSFGSGNMPRLATRRFINKKS